MTGTGIVTSSSPIIHAYTHIGGKFIFHQYQSSVNIDIQSVAHEKTNYIHKNQWNVIIHSCFNSNGSFAKPPIKLGMD